MKDLYIINININKETGRWFRKWKNIPAFELRVNTVIKMAILCKAINRFKAIPSQITPWDFSQN